MSDDQAPPHVTGPQALAEADAALGSLNDYAPGWQVLDPDGNVVDSGALTELEAVGNPDDEEQEQ